MVTFCCFCLVLHPYLGTISWTKRFSGIFCGSAQGTMCCWELNLDQIFYLLFSRVKRTKTHFRKSLESQAYLESYNFYKTFTWLLFKQSHTDFFPASALYFRPYVFYHQFIQTLHFTSWLASAFLNLSRPNKHHNFHYLNYYKSESQHHCLKWTNLGVTGMQKTFNKYFITVLYFLYFYISLVVITSCLWYPFHSFFFLQPPQKFKIS